MSTDPLAWIFLIIFLAVIFIIVGYWYKGKYSRIKRTVKQKPKQEAEIIPLAHDTPKDIFKYNFEMWAGDGRRAMKIQALEFAGLIGVFLIFYFWGIIEMMTNFGAGLTIFIVSIIGLCLAFGVIWLIFNWLGYRKLGSLILISLGLAPEDGTFEESGRFHVIKMEEISKSDFTDMIENQALFESLREYRAKKKNFEEEVETYKEKHKRKDPPFGELKRLREVTKFLPNELFDILIKVTEPLESPLARDFYAQVAKLEDQEHLNSTILYLAHPETPDQLALKLIIPTRESSFKDHLGIPVPVKLFLFGNSFDAKEFTIDLQVVFQGRNLIPIAEVTKSSWTLQHPKKIFGDLITLTPEVAQWISHVVEIWDSFRLLNIVREQGRIIAEHDRERFDKRAEVKKELATVIELMGLDDLNSIFDTGLHLPRSNVFYISIFGAVFVICLTIGLISLFGGA